MTQNPKRTAGFWAKKYSKKFERNYQVYKDMTGFAHQKKLCKLG